MTELNDQVRHAWNANAAFWDSRMADGNDFQRLLVAPATERLLDLRPDELVLDAACGNGVMARRLAEQGAKVLAFDFAENMIEAARSRGTFDGAIGYRVVDATDLEAMLALGTDQFDGAVCNMAIMDMAEIDPLMTAISHLLKAEGRFVFSVCHPCFNHSGCGRVLEEVDEGGIVSKPWLKVFRYKSAQPSPGIAMRGQPEPQLYFDRTLADLFEACFRASMVITQVAEPTFPDMAESLGAKPTHLELFQEIPPVLAVRAERR